MRFGIHPATVTQRKAAAAVAALTMGGTTGVRDDGTSANLMQVRMVQASQSGSFPFINIVGPTGVAGSTSSFILAVYSATSSSNATGSLLATATGSNLTQGETRKLTLNTPVSIVSGNWYALGILPNATTNTRSASALSGRFWADTYSDGALASSPAGSGSNPDPVIFLTTT